ncbi:hypothetical protein PR202_gb14475 [Eleusine coracana subsp. coracana]|uniref:RRM domain-containing protein n=1 Tax=Eleusine coracana subsp. coracana TaxID=191504 RepID=A0AAV5EUT8_ELECO|nr:hypothetical protein PR202_gb14475 [Eleusine coracana subsp. coracana]
MAIKSGFTRPRQRAEDSASPTPSAVLYVANCGPAVGVTDADVREAFGAFGEVAGVHAADDSGARVIVRFHEPAAAGGRHGRAPRAPLRWPCGPRPAHTLLGARETQGSLLVPRSQVAVTASELGIPGIYMVEEFLTAAEEQELLAAVDSRPWKSLAKRRVQHYGYEFLYETRNVDSKQFLGELPDFVSTVLQKIISFPGVNKCSTKLVDQLTVVGVLQVWSLELMKIAVKSQTYKESHFPTSTVDVTDVRRRPHHKIDDVRGQIIRRNSRRVSFTFRKVRLGPCQCEYKQFCDSHGKIS